MYKYWYSHMIARHLNHRPQALFDAAIPVSKG